MTTDRDKEQSQVKACAEDLYIQLSELSEDILEDLWFNFREDYLEFADHCTSEELDAWQEPIFRQVMAELSALCTKRAQGETP